MAANSLLFGMRNNFAYELTRQRPIVQSAYNLLGLGMAGDDSIGGRKSRDPTTGRYKRAVQEASAPTNKREHRQSRLVAGTYRDPYATWGIGWWRFGTSIRRAVRFFLENPGWRLFMLAAEVGAVAAAVVALYQTMGQSEQASRQTEMARQALLDQRVSSAWQILSLGGMGGKGYALSTLVGMGEMVTGLNLSCEQPVEICRQKQHGLYRVTLAGDSDPEAIERDDMSHGGLGNSQLNGVVLWRATLKDLALVDVDLSGADVSDLTANNVWFTDVSFRNALVGATFRDSGFNRVDLSGAEAGYLEFVNPDFGSMNLTGAILFDLKVGFSTPETQYWPDLPAPGTVVNLDPVPIRDGTVLLPDFFGPRPMPMINVSDANFINLEVPPEWFGLTYYFDGHPPTFAFPPDNVGIWRIPVDWPLDEMGALSSTLPGTFKTEQPIRWMSITEIGQVD